MPDSKLIENIWVLVRKVGNSSLGAQNVIEDLQVNLPRFRNLIAPNRCKVEFLSRFLNDKFENSVRAVSYVGPFVTNWRNEKALRIHVRQGG